MRRLIQSRPQIDSYKQRRALSMLAVAMEAYCRNEPTELKPFKSSSKPCRSPTDTHRNSWRSFTSILRRTANSSAFQMRSCGEYLPREPSKATVSSNAWPYVPEVMLVGFFALRQDVLILFPWDGARGAGAGTDIARPEERTHILRRAVARAVALRRRMGYVGPPRPATLAGYAVARHVPLGPYPNRLCNPRWKKVACHSRHPKEPALAVERFGYNCCKQGWLLKKSS